MKASKTFIILVLLFTSVLSCGESSSSNASESELINRINAVQEQVMVQGNITKEEEQAILSLCSIMTHNDGLSNYDIDKRIVLKDVEIAPIYKGCEELPTEESMRCFKDNISTFIKEEFDSSLSKALNLPEPKQVDAFFIISESGEVTGLKVRDSEVTIQAEILRVLRSIPTMKPAVHNGKPVSVLCSISLKYGNDVEADVVYIPEIPDNSEFE